MYFVLMFFVPKSPRWLFSNNKSELAKEVLISIHGAEKAETETKAIINNIESNNTKKYVKNLVSCLKVLKNQIIITDIDKKAYLSSLKLADHIVVTCDSTSMISEAATSGKPIFVAHMKTKRNNYRFKRFFDLFKKMGITRDLGEKIETWSYNKHNEAQRIAIELKNKIEN